MQRRRLTFFERRFENLLFAPDRFPRPRGGFPTGVGGSAATNVSQPAGIDLCAMLRITSQIDDRRKTSKRLVIEINSNESINGEFECAKYGTAEGPGTEIAPAGGARGGGEGRGEGRGGEAEEKCNQYVNKRLRDR